MTAEAVYAQQTHPPRQPVIASQLLREQNFGRAEGKTYKARTQPGLSLAEHYSRGMFPAPSSRDDRFPDGESLNDLVRRAERAIEEILLPYVQHAAKGKDVHVAVVSHGLFIKEMVTALMKRNAGGVHNLEVAEVSKGLRNTAWTRLTVEERVRSSYSAWAFSLIAIFSNCLAALSIQVLLDS